MFCKDKKKKRMSQRLCRDIRSVRCRVYAGRLALGDSTAGANLSAASAADALVRIDVVDLALGNSLYGANRLAGAASNTVVVNNVSHDKINV